MRWKKIVTNPFFIAFLIGIASLHIIKHFAMLRRSAPDPIAIVPDWQLMDQDGNPVGKSSLRGKLVIANYFFTTCPSICPKLTEAMKEVYERLKKHGDKVQFLSITVDPETDTPQVLRAYMLEASINKSNWRCLTGSKKDIHDVVVNKMRVHVGEKEKIHGSDELYDIPHLAQLALFDQNGDLRGLFRTETVELAALVRAADFLLEQPPK